MTKQNKPRLGRGLASLIGTPVEVKPSGSAPVTIIVNDDVVQNPLNKGDVDSKRGETERGGSGARSLPVSGIVPGRFQPRESFDDAALAGLASSIRASGVMQPVLVRRAADGADRWELVAGERRWRAAKLAGLDRIPAVVVELDDRGAAEWSLVENVQREDLSAMERARALRVLVDRFGVTHAQVGERVGLERSSVANLIRLTELEPEVQALLTARDAGESGGLTMGHGKVLLGARPGATRVRLAQRAAKERWSVRQLEGAVRASVDGAARAGTPTQTEGDPQVRDLERQLSEFLGTKVRVSSTPDRARGKIVIDFYGVEHFDGLLRSLGVRIES